MSKLGRAVTGVIVSAAVAVGGYAAQENRHDREFDAMIQCRQELGGSAVQACLDDANNIYGSGSLPMGLVELAGALGVALNGYIGYKAVKEENDTTGMFEDFM